MESTNIVTWKEVSRDYIKNLNNDGILVLIYNPLTRIYHIELANKNCIAHSKNALTSLKYYILVEGY